VAPYVQFDPAISAHDQMVLADAQTNGGLLAAVPADAVDRLRRALERADVQAAVVGEVRAGAPRIEVHAR
jgi:selenide,water dikinase